MLPYEIFEELTIKLTLLFINVLISYSIKKILIHITHHTLKHKLHSYIYMFI